MLTGQIIEAVGLTIMGFAFGMTTLALANIAPDYPDFHKRVEYTSKGVVSSDSKGNRFITVEYSGGVRTVAF